MRRRRGILEVFAPEVFNSGCREWLRRLRRGIPEVFAPEVFAPQSQPQSGMEVMVVLAVQVATVLTVAVTNRTNTSNGFASLDGEAKSEVSVKAPSFPHVAETHTRSDTIWA